MKSAPNKKSHPLFCEDNSCSFIIGKFLVIDKRPSFWPIAYYPKEFVLKGIPINVVIDADRIAFLARRVYKETLTDAEIEEVGEAIVARLVDEACGHINKIITEEIERVIKRAHL